MSEAAGLLRDHLDYLLTRIKLYVARHAHRMVQADGTLSDLFVSLAEASALLDGHGERPGPPAVVDELAARKGRIEERRADDAPIERLRTLFRLDDVQVALLVAAAAPLISIDIARLYSFAWSDFTVKQPTVGFLAELLADLPSLIPTLLDELRDDGALVRHRLVVRHDAPPWGSPTPLLHRAVTVPDRIVAFLLGRDERLPPAVAEACRLSTPAQSTPSAALLVSDGVANNLSTSLDRAAADPARRPRLLLLGKDGSGRRTLLGSFAAARGHSLLTVELERLPVEPHRFDDALREACREALLCNAVLLLRGDKLFDDQDRLLTIDRLLARTINEHAGIVAFTARHPVAHIHRLVDGLFEVVVPAPTPEQQRELWRQAIAGVGARAEARIEERLADRFDIGPGAIHRAVEEARARAVWTSPDPREPELRAGEIIEAVRRQADHALSQIAEPFSTTLTWDDVVLPDDLTDGLFEILNHARYRQFVLDDWGFRRKLAYGRGLSCLFSGPPGTGKTMVAAILAESLGRELYRIDLSRVSSKWVGETEKNLARVFDEAERAQVILLFDEADSLFSTRTEVKSANDRFANMEINYLLQRMESYDGMTLLTTNFEKSLDEAFKRRIKFRLHFPLPDAAHRTQLWQSMIPPQAHVDKNIRFDALGEKFEFSGGAIKNAVLRAAFYAVEQGQPISYAFLHRAAMAEAVETGRLVNG